MHPPPSTPPPPPYQPPAPAGTTTSGKATAALVFAIASFVICPIIPAIVALILASQARREITASYGRVGGEGMVTASRVLSIINIVLSLVLVPIMLAIAIPTFLGAQDRARDRTTQIELTQAFSAQQTFYSSNQQWAANPSDLSALEPSVQYESGDTPAREGVVYVVVEGPLLGLSAKSEGGDCFYVMSSAEDSSVLYAEDETCGRAQDQDYQQSWE